MFCQGLSVTHVPRGSYILVSRVRTDTQSTRPPRDILNTAYRNMDMDSFLNLEKRTNIGNADIDEFVRKASAVEAAVRAMQAGEVAPEDVRIEGIDTEEEKAEKERKRLERRAQLQREEEELRVKRKQEERERWWAGAELFAQREPDGDNDDEGSGPVSSQTQRMNRYSMDYSRWDVWDPQDPATLQERLDKQAEEDAVANAEFESNNPEFCQQFKEDMDKRKKTTQKKLQNSNDFKLKGNRYFKAKKYEDALVQYMEALKLSPYEGVAVLTNIAQANIKLKVYDDAIEFLNRALYLEPGNIKALSRKAFVLGECLGGVSNIEEAIRCAEKAHRLDSTNAEVACQFNELRILLEDIHNEEAVRCIATGPQSQKLSSLRQQAASSDSKGAMAVCESLLSGMGEGEMATAAGFCLLEDLKRLLDGLALVMCPSPEGTEDSSIEGNAAVGYDEPTQIRDKALVEAVADLLVDDQSCRVYLRTSGGWDQLVRCIKAIATHPSLFQAELPEDSRVRGALALLGPLLRVLSRGAAAERTTKLAIAADGQLFGVIKSLLVRADAPVDVLHGGVVFVEGCSDACCSKLRSLVLKERSLLVDLGGSLCHLNDIVCGKVNGASTEQKAQASVAMIACCNFVRDVTFSEEWKKNLTSLSVPIVAVLGSVLNGRKCWKKALSTDKCKAMTEVLLESLLGCSQSELLRDAFLLPLANSDTPNTIHCVLDLCRADKRASANGLAILMNVTIQDNEQTRRTVLNAGGLNVCLSQLQEIVAPGEEYSRVRAIGLLSRLSTLSEVQECIRQPDNYRSLCLAFLQNCSVDKTDGKYEKWVLDERSQLVRTIAAVSNPSEACMSAGGELGMVQALLGCLPSPRQELLQITPTSVILPPNETINPILLGNIARCLMPYADNKVYGAIIYTDSRHIGVEKLICMMASCTDMRVRKNIAILLAKGCRIPAAKQRIEHLRGLQMLVELQDKL